MARLAEKHESLWWLILSPVIWAVHFLAAYITVAIYCAKIAPESGPLGVARVLVAVYSAVALVGIGLVALRSWRHHSFGRASVPHDFDTPADRHRFLGYAGFLLSGLSAVGVIYETLPLLFIGSCR